METILNVRLWLNIAESEWGYLNLYPEAIRRLGRSRVANEEEVILDERDVWVQISIIGSAAAIS
ncbi:MAG: hypothetical protein KGR16_04630 [Verrucomicrobia bacterium]|nr:hypothetical protein [Verrucomicrobiota bacterium]